MTDLSSEVLTVAEAADLLRCSVDVVYDMVRRNEIPHGRLGRSIRFHRRALESYLGWSGASEAASEDDEGPRQRAPGRQPASATMRPGSSSVPRWPRAAQPKGDW